MVQTLSARRHPRARDPRTEACPGQGPARGDMPGPDPGARTHAWARVLCAEAPPGQRPGRPGMPRPDPDQTRGDMPYANLSSPLQHHHRYYQRHHRRHHHVYELRTPITRVPFRVHIKTRTPEYPSTTLQTSQMEARALRSIGIPKPASTNSTSVLPRSDSTTVPQSSTS